MMKSFLVVVFFSGAASFLSKFKAGKNIETSRYSMIRLNSGNKITDY